MMKRIIECLCIFASLSACKGDASFDNSVANNGSGRGGSLARFTIVDDHLYIVNENSLNTFEIDASQNISRTGSTEIDAFAETIFPFKNHLLLGTRTGMFVYSLQNAGNPTFLSQYSHMASCDPVVAAGNFAYVTLRNGSPCRRGINQLDVLNIANLGFPRLVRSEQMLNPFGLATKGDKLFVCEKDFGLTMFDISSPENIVKLKTFDEIKAFDIIVSGNRMIFTGDDGISQYSESISGDLQFLSKINLNE